YNGGYRSPDLTAYLKGNQCENCHGPASRHVSEPDNVAFRQPLKLDAAEFDRNRRCVHCHDEDNSPEFSFQKYYSQIAHKGLDRYDDPKVHQGITPKFEQPGP